ncbi:MAG: exodeoxyribonuclease VII large subunit [Elusimicrobiota bacterium]
MSNNKVYTVTELTALIKDVLSSSYPDVWLTGEVSNFSVPASGHMYFTLKDDNAQISVVMWHNANQKLKFAVEDGMKLLIRGSLTVFDKYGKYQIIAKTIEPSGKGELQIRFEQLKAKLEAEGLFDAARKRVIPEMPQRIGVVTSPTGAAIRDILNILKRRFSNLEILIYPVAVQGEVAAGEIAGAITGLNKYFPELDVLLVGRGGGSIEDLWAFNEEIVARAIAASDIPIISCVGHQVDFTIADFVADLRAETPSAAAEIVVKNKDEVLQRITSLFTRLKNNIEYLSANLELRVQSVTKSRVFTYPLEIIRPYQQLTDEFGIRISREVMALSELMGQKVSSLAERVKLIHVIRLTEERLNSVTGKLSALSPLGVLSRGYSIVTNQTDGKVVKSSTQVESGDGVKIRLGNGVVFGKIVGKDIEDA